MATTTATFSNVSVLPAGWSSTDIGAPGISGWAGYDAGSNAYSVNGGGLDFGAGSSDQFNLTNRSFTGDGSVIARVKAPAGGDPAAKAGVMIRSDATASAAFESLSRTRCQRPGFPVALRQRRIGPVRDADEHSRGTVAAARSHRRQHPGRVLLQRRGALDAGRIKPLDHAHQRHGAGRAGGHRARQCGPAGRDILRCQHRAGRRLDRFGYRRADGAGGLGRLRCAQQYPHADRRRLGHFRRRRPVQLRPPQHERRRQRDRICEFAQQRRSAGQGRRDDPRRRHRLRRFRRNICRCPARADFRIAPPTVRWSSRRSTRSLAHRSA